MPRGIPYTEVSYTSPIWYRLRARQLKRFPWCRYCQLSGLRVRATHVDHVIPHRGDSELFADEANLQSLCALHANTTKQVEEILGEEIGCSLDGTPRGKNHPWHGGSPDVPKNTAQKIGRLLRDRKRK